ncbi:hypothetical protein K474DRAFT_892514 [Panus rudis PR-1116 ss-1]|nr:hypothetical protein K474DRAFT_892514 [Panus rudis PR-1116 ss-1]
MVVESYFLFFAQSIYISRCSVAASLAILYYDWLLTLPSEVEYYWKRKWSTTSFFYFLNRYCSLLAHIPVIVEFYADLSEESFHQLYSAVTVVLVGILLTIRTYAIYGQSRTILSVILSYMIIGFGIAVWAMITNQRLPGAPFDEIPSWYKACGSHLSDQQEIYLSIALSIAMGGDIMIFCLTLYRGIIIAKTTKNRLLVIIMRDGTVYFGVMILTHALNMISTLKYRDIIEVTTLTAIISSTLMSRLMLNIRNPRNSTEYSEELSATPIASIAFANRDMRRRRAPDSLGIDEEEDMDYEEEMEGEGDGVEGDEGEQSVHGRGSGARDVESQVGVLTIESEERV